MAVDGGTASKDSAAVSTIPSREPAEGAIRDWRFWLIIVSLMLSTFIFALETVAIGNALPIIVNELRGSQFVWVGSSYSLAASAFLPMTGSLSHIFGRRDVILVALLLFAIGSAVAGSASSMSILILGRSAYISPIQGVGGGGITSVSQIILSDLVPLRERGTFSGILAIAFTIACCIGPVVSGALAQHGQWRWLFYLNIPICGAAGALTLVFLKLKIPPGSLREKAKHMDWIGNFLVISSTTAVVIALTWGGIQFPWNSAKVIVPLILGLVGLGLFLLYDATRAGTPMVPFLLISNRTSLSGHLQTFLNQIITCVTIYYLPVYFQGCKDASPIASGVDCFGIAATASPTAIITGITVTKSSKYRPQLWFAWSLSLIGCGLLSSLNADDSRAKAIGYQILVGIGIGMIYLATYFPVLAPLPISENTRALAFFVFLRNFALVWGITIGGTILQNELRKNLPAEFVSAFGEDTQIAYAAIPQIPSLPQPLKDEVRRAFADSVRVIWQVLTGISGLGLLISLAMKGLPLHTSTDEDWGMQERKDVVTKEVTSSDSSSAVNQA
ncbi:MFS general substrate transporter [Dentipellis sp. KUC8613]|nr:MFS general substrate transporter [Dentipellis sp. KUC8613]